MENFEKYFQSELEKGTVPWAIFRFRIFLNHLSHKFEKIKKNCLKECSTYLSMKIVVDIFINISTYEKHFQKVLKFGPRQGLRLVSWAIHFLHLCILCYKVGKYTIFTEGNICCPSEARARNYMPEVKSTFLPCSIRYFSPDFN